METNELANDTKRRVRYEERAFQSRVRRTVSTTPRRTTKSK